MNTTHARKVNLGSISHGTLRNEDLIPTFAGELERLIAGSGAYLWARPLIDKARALKDFNSEEAAEVSTELEDALTSFAPPFCYFGAHPGDGADFGFWFDHDAFEQARQDGEVATGSDLDDAKRKPEAADADYLAVVSDHGNVTIYDKQGNELVGVV